MKLTTGILVTILAFAPFGAHAAPGDVSSWSPDTVVKGLQEAGYKAKLSKDSDGDPIIESAANGVNFTLNFTACVKGAKCEQIELFAFWTCDGHEKQCREVHQKWSADERFASSTINEKLVGLYKYIVFDERGISQSAFAKNIELFADDITSFRATFP